MLLSRSIFWIAALLDGMLACLTLRQRGKRIRMSVAAVICSAAIGTLLYGFSISTDDYFEVSVFSSLYFITLDAMVFCLYRFVANYTGYYSKGKGRLKYRLPVIVLILADMISLILNPFTEHALTYSPTAFSGYTVYLYDPKFAYTCHLFLSYLLVLLSVALLVYKSLKTPRLYRRRYLYILAILLFIVFLNAVYLYGAGALPIDYSIIIYTIASGLIYYYAFYRADRSLLNTTRVFIIDSLEYPVLTFDYDNRLCDYNRRADMLFGSLNDVKESRTDLTAFCHRFGLPAFIAGDGVYHWTRISADVEYKYDCEIQSLYDRSSTIIGRYVTIKDVTYLKDSITGLDLYSGLSRHLSELLPVVDAPAQILSFNVNALNTINNALGHDRGNQVMQHLTECIRSTIGANQYMARTENGTIVAILSRTTVEQAEATVADIHAAVIKTSNFEFDYDFEYGIAEYNHENSDGFAVLNESLRSLGSRKLLSRGAHDSMLLHSLTQTLLENDFETEAHANRTRNVAAQMAKALKLSANETARLQLLCTLHDIGKIGIPHQILLKPDKLTDDEWSVMKTHAEKGYRIAMASPELEPIAPLILHHHEHWDGSGYPGGMRGEGIPLLSRIIAIIDSFDVMTHDRPYHKAVSIEEAKAELKRCAGTQFDPALVDTFLNMINEADISLLD